MMKGSNNRIIESDSFILHDTYQQGRYVKNVYILIVVKTLEYYMKNYVYDIKYLAKRFNPTCYKDSVVAALPRYS